MEDLKFYIIFDPRKFSSVEEAEKEVERIRASIVRKKRKTKQIGNGNLGGSLHQDHLLRKIDKSIDFSFINKNCKIY